jgi:O-methyltransferase
MSVSVVPLSPPLAIETPEETSWYQTVDWPDGSVTTGKWDYRRDGGRDYLGRLDYAGKSVLEIGPASGYLTKQMALAGADVTCIELSDDEAWQVVPRKDVDAAAYIAQRKAGLNTFRKAWWLTQKRWGTNARIAYTGISRLAQFRDPRFDVATLTCVLQHFENPVRVLYEVGELAETVVVVNLQLRWVERTKAAFFIPNSENEHLGSWWHLSSGVIQQVMETAGFRRVDHYTMTYDRNVEGSPTPTEFFCSVFRKQEDIVPRSNTTGQ